MNNNYINMSGFATNYYGRQERICPICGKEFSPAPEHSYYINGNKLKLVCSYTCVRKWEKNPKAQYSSGISGKKAGIAVRFVETGEEFVSISECAEHLNTSYSIIDHCIRYGYPFKGVHIERVKK